MDPLAVLGLEPGASHAEITAAYRRLAKRWHPDREHGPEAQRRMADLNAAYSALVGPGRRRSWRTRPGPEPAPRPAMAGHWLERSVRRALGAELLAALEPHEDVRLVVPASTWASPRTLLAVTDRRLLWLNDDAVTGRVRSLRHRSIASADVRRGWGRRSAAVRVQARSGRRLSFAGLEPAVAAAIVRHVGEALPSVA